MARIPALAAMTAIEIPLSHGLVALIDAGDADAVLRYHWTAFRKPGTEIWYARRSAGRKAKVYMHSAVTGWTLVDHRDRNGLNNQRSNLRPATKSQNAANSPGRSNSTQPFKGVRPNHPGSPTWAARIQTRHLGTFATAEEAARAYDRAAVETFGEFAWLNFPEGL